MKTIITSILLFSSVNFAFAQQKYYTFSLKGKYGITDTLGNETIKPTFGYMTEVSAKDQVFLQDCSEKPDIIFNTKTGAQQRYESVYNNQVTIKNVPYSIVVSKRKKHLLSEETDKTIALSQDYSDFKNIGKYIIAKFYPQLEPVKSGARDKNGILLPPKIREFKEYYTVLADDESLKPIAKGNFDKYLPLYKVPVKSNDDGIIREVTITILPDSEKPNFDFIVLSKGNSRNLYDSNMTLVKTFVLAKADDEKLADACSKIVKMELALTAAENGYGGLVSAPPNGIGYGTKSATAKAEKKEPFVPFFYVKKLSSGNTLFALQETEEISKHIFEVSSKYEVTIDKRQNTITIETDEEKVCKFSFNPQTGAIYLPKSYLKSLGIMMI